MQNGPMENEAQTLRSGLPTQAAVARDRLLRLKEVEFITAQKKSTLYNLLRDGKFVKPIRIGERAVFWSETAVLQWVQDRIKESTQTTA